MQDGERDGGAGHCQDEQRQDEEGGLLARFFGGLGDPEGVDEGVGEEVDETHSSIMRRCGAGWNFESCWNLRHLLR